MTRERRESSAPSSSSLLLFFGRIVDARDQSTGAPHLQPAPGEEQLRRPSSRESPGAKDDGRGFAPPSIGSANESYCLSYTAVLFIAGSGPVVVTVRDLPSGERPIFPVMVVLPPFFIVMLSECFPEDVYERVS